MGKGFEKTSHRKRNINRILKHIQPHSQQMHIKTSSDAASHLLGSAKSQRSDNMFCGPSCDDEKSQHCSHRGQIGSFHPDHKAGAL